MHSRLKYNPNSYFSFEKIIYEKAKETNNKIVNLDKQLLQNAYTQLFIEYDIGWLLKMVENSDIELTDDLIIQSWLRQDTTPIKSILRKQQGYDSKHQKVLIDDRNKHWFRVIDQHSSRTNFIYCGLAHIIFGEFSLLNFFSGRHYTVKGIDIKINP